MGKPKNKKKTAVKHTPKSEKAPLVKNTSLNVFMKRERVEKDNRR